MPQAITGNTYPVKDALRAMGAKWDADAKAWMIADAKADEARRLVAGAPAQQATPGKCLKCKGPVKPPYTVCYGCKNSTSPSGGGGSYRRGRSNRAPGGRTCPNCGSRSCSAAWDGSLCDED